MESLWDAIEGRLRFLLALPLALVPARHWDQLEEMAPVRSAALISGLLVFFIGAAIFIPGYLGYAQGQSGNAVEHMLEATGWRTPSPDRAGATPDQQVGMAGVEWGMTFFSIFTFVLYTPTGLFATYLGASGWIRVICAWVDD